MYTVIYEFADMQDDNYIYRLGDAYPRDGYFSTPERIEELASEQNRIGRALIEEVKEVEVIEEPIVEEEPKPRRRKRASAE